MTVEALRRSPLGARAAELAAASTSAVSYAEVPFLTMLDLRVGPSSEAAEAVASVLGVRLPGSGRVSTSGEVSVLWLGPDEWLVVAPSPSVLPLLSDAVGGAGSVVDVSANRTTVELAGPAAPDVLAAGCALDLDQRSFSAGSCAVTLLGRLNVILWQTSDAPTYRLLVRGSYAGFLADWLLDAGLEYRV